MIPAETAIVLFDGRCRLCSGWVRFILRRDRKGRIRFAALDSATARDLLRGVGAGGGGVAGGSTGAEGGIHAGTAGIEPSVYGGMDSVVLVARDRSIHVRSSAALRILRELGGMWRVLYMLIAVPRPIRDAVYDFVARRRYTWFGRLDRTFQPSEDDAWRFLD